MQKAVAIAVVALAAICSRPALAEGQTSASDIVGSWNVVVEVGFSTCSRTKVGDALAEHWRISLEQGRITIHVSGDPYNNGFTDGRFKLNSLVLRNTGAVDDTFDLKVEGDSFSGSRVLGFAQHVALGETWACVVLAKVKARRQ